MEESFSYPNHLSRDGKEITYHQKSYFDNNGNITCAMFLQGITGWENGIFHFSEHLGKSYYHDRLELIKGY